MDAEERRLAAAAAVTIDRGSGPADTSAGADAGGTSGAGGQGS
jgi:hypothetical protein